MKNALDKAKEGFEEWLTLQETADWLKIPESSLREYVRNGTVPFFKIGRHTRFKKEFFSATRPRREIR